MGVKTMKRNNRGYTGLILSVLVILGFVIYAWTQLAEKHSVEAYESPESSGNAGTEAVWHRTSDKKAVEPIYRRGSSKIEDAKPSGKVEIQKTAEKGVVPVLPGATYSADILHDFSAMAADQNYSVAERLKFAKQVRLQHGSKELADGDVEQRLLELLEGDPSAEFRTGLVRMMKGMNSELLVVPLVQRVSSDDDAAVRTATLMTLAEYRKKPEVRSALKTATLHDPDAEVQAKAREILDMRD